MINLLKTGRWRPLLRLATFPLTAHALLLTSGCTSLSEAIAPKVNVADFTVEDTQTNRIKAANSIQSIAKQFGFVEDHRQDWSQPLFVFSYSESHSSPVYQIQAYVRRSEIGINATNDIIDPPLFAARLTHPSMEDHLCNFISTRLAPSTLMLLANSSKQTNANLQKSLAIALNSLIFTNRSIYDVEGFKGIPPSEETALLLKKKPTGGDLYLLNRLLLQDAFPGQIRRIGNDEIVISLAHANFTGMKTTKYNEIQDAIMQALKKTFGSGMNFNFYREHSR